MKKIILSAFILISFFAFPLFSQASYIIHLKGGGRFITTKYWEEGGQITFFVSGGTMGIEKDTVKAIEKSKLEPEDVYETKKSVPPATIEKMPATANVIMKEGTQKEDAKTEVKSGNPPKDPVIMKEFEQLQKSFDRRESMSIDELESLKSDLTDLRDKISADSRLSDLHSVEKVKLGDMRFLTNNLIVLKSKTR